MIKYDFTFYQELLDSFDYEQNSFNPQAEIFQEYIKIVDKFDPINQPPKAGEKLAYVLEYIIPITLEYARDFKAIIYYASSVTITPQYDHVTLELYFSAE